VQNTSLPTVAVFMPWIVALVSAAAALIGKAALDEGDLSGTRAQIEFLLTHLAIEMGMVRDFPEYPTVGFADYLARLRERVFSSDGACALRGERRRRVLEALSVAEQSHVVIERFRSRDVAIEEAREYLSGTADP
jgi:hypothetical protein